MKYLENPPAWALRNMIKALSFHSWLNTDEEKQRLKIAKLILKNRKV